MANKYTQIFNAPYVPQYAPPNMQTFQQAGSILTDRQQQGMEQYDALQESLNSIDVLESDRPVLQQKAEEINQDLSKFEETNDFIDAVPAIRRKARNLQKSMQEGTLGEAVLNKQNALKTFENIEESDWSPQKKEAMKQMYLKDYGGAQRGDRLGVYAPPEYVNIEEEAAKAAKSVDETTYDTIQYVQDTTTGQPVKAKVKRSGRELSRIRQSVTDMFQNNEGVRNTLITEARLNGRETPEEIQDYINKKAEGMALDMQTRFGAQDTTFTGVQWDEGSGASTNVGPNSRIRETSEPGIIQAQNLVPNLEDHISEMRRAKIEGNQDKYETMKDGLSAVATTAIEKGDLSMDEYRYFLNNLDERADEVGFGLGDVLGFAKQAISNVTGVPMPQAPEDERFKSIAQKLSGTVEDNEGVVGTSFLFTNPESKANKQVAMTLQNSNPNNFDVVSSEQVEGMDEDEKNQFIKQTLVNGTPEGITFVSDDASPFYKFRKENDEGEIETIFLREKSTPNIKGAGYRTPFENVVEAGLKEDAVAQQMLGTYKLHNVPSVGENVYERLPQEYKATLGEFNYISPQTHEGGGITLDVGSEDDHKPISKFEFLMTANDRFIEDYSSNPNKAPENYQIMANMIENSTTLLETEKRAILESLGSGENLPVEPLKKLQAELDVPYQFDNKIEAINFARQIR